MVKEFEKERRGMKKQTRELIAKIGLSIGFITAAIMLIFLIKYIFFAK